MGSAACDLTIILHPSLNTWLAAAGACRPQPDCVGRRWWYQMLAPLGYNCRVPPDLFGEEEPMVPKKQSPAHSEPPAPETTQRFEEAFARLETLVEEMEHGDLSLEELLARFEEGVGLVRVCQEFLKRAQERVEQFVELRDGAWVLKELEEQG